MIYQALHNHRQDRAIWWQIAENSQLCCTMLLESRIKLAQIAAEPVNRVLDFLADWYCGIQLDKGDAYRLRYGELVGLSVEKWTGTEQRFWTYASKDPIATSRCEDSLDQSLLADSHDWLGVERAGVGHRISQLPRAYFTSTGLN